MQVETRLFLAADPAIQELKAEALAARLVPTQLEHEIDWVTQSQHGAKTDGAILGLYRGGQLGGYVPLRYQRAGLSLRFAGTKLGNIPYRTVQLWGPGIVTSDDSLIAPALSALSRLPWPFHAVQLFDTPTESPLWRAIEAGSAPGYTTVEHLREENYLVDLPKTFDQYNAQFSSKTRSTLRRKAKKLESECGQLSMRTYARPEDVLPLVDVIEPLLKKTYHYHLLGHDLTRANRTWVQNQSLFAARGWLHGYVLFGGDQPIAYVIGNGACRRFVYEYPAYDPERAAHSPGLILLLRIMEDLIRQGNTDVVDFGSGYADYKKLFSTRSFCGVNALLVRRKAYARGAVAVERSIASISALGARVLERYQVKSKVKNWLRQLKLGG